MRPRCQAALLARRLHIDLMRIVTACCPTSC